VFFRQDSKKPINKSLGCEIFHFKNEDFLHFRFAESWEIFASTVPRVGSRFLSRRNLWRSYLAWPGTGKVGHEKIPANDFRLFFLDFFSTSATPHRKLSM
jgi:hypothetical protein